KISIGWAQVRIDLLEARPLQCYRCLKKGHIQSNCGNSIDRRRNCYKCGEEGHLASGCEAKARCQIYEERGQASRHRMGGPACHPNKKKVRKGQR
ncbi:Gag-Pol polyprotein, partial [Harpegnathos saltator]